MPRADAGASSALRAEMLDHVRVLGIGGRWAGGQVGRGRAARGRVSELRGADGLVRAVRRLGDALHAHCTAINTGTPWSHTPGDDDHRRRAAVINLATPLGSAVMTITSAAVLEGLTTVASLSRYRLAAIGDAREAQRTARRLACVRVTAAWRRSGYGRRGGKRPSPRLRVGQRRERVP